MFSQLSFIQGEDNLPFELLSEGKKLEHVGIRDKDRPEGVITFVEGPEGKDSFKQPLTLDVNINKIGKIVGSWKGQFQINPEKLISKTNLYEKRITQYMSSAIFIYWFAFIMFVSYIILTISFIY